VPGPLSLDRAAGSRGGAAERERDSLRVLLDDPVARDAPEPPVPLPLASVTAVLVVHDGLRWLPDVLAAVAAQTRQPDRLVAVDTGSVDAGPALLVSSPATVATVVTLPRATGFGAAVAAGLDTLEVPPDEPEPWVWLLHDDCAPEPACLEELLRAAGATRGVGVLGPKVRDWDDPRRLVEAGLTVDRAGRRVTGLEAVELDQGQHDALRDVLAVGSAGALVRRSTWEQLHGTDPDLPLFRDDVDLCWRVGLAGQRVVLAPAAVVRHARAVATGLRAADAVAGAPRRNDRAHGLRIQLANAGFLAFALGLPRLVVAGMLRSAGYLLTRRPHLAREEAAAAGGLLLHLPRLVRARRWRAGQRAGPASAVTALLQPRGARLQARAGAAADWLASGGDAAATLAGPPGGLETGPVAEDEELLPADDASRLRRVLTRPGLLLTVALGLLTLLAGHSLLGGGVLAGGRLLPPTLGASDLWSSWAATWHPGPFGGSPTPAAPWTPWLALLSGATLGRVSLAVDLLLLGCVPAAGLAAWRASRALAAGTGVRIWAATTYAVLPVATGSVARGRFDTAVALVAAPALLAAGHRLLAGEPSSGGWRRGWALGLLLAAASAFAPPLFPLAAALLLICAAIVGVAGRSLRPAAAVLLPLLVPPVLALPWLPRLVADPAVLLTGLGRPGGVAGIGVRTAPTGVDLLTLHAVGDGGAGVPPAWVLVPLLALALAALARTAPLRRRAALALWGVALAALGAAVLASRARVPGDAPGGDTGWAGPALAVGGAAVVGAAVLAAQDLRRRLGRRSFGWRQLSAGLLVAAALPVPLLLAGSWLQRGAGMPLARRDVALLPLDVLADAAAADPRQRVLVLRREPLGAVRYDLRGLAGARLGDEELVSSPAAGGLLRALAADLATARGTDAAETLATFDVSVVAVPGDARTPLTDALDAQPALSRRPTRSHVSLWRTTVPTARLQVLGPGLAAAAGQAAAATTGTGRGPDRAALAAEPPLALDSGPEGARVALAAGPEGRLLVLSEAADPGWVASVDGRPLARRTAWGWAQSFALPATGGTLEVHRRSEARHLLLVGQALALLIVAVLAAPSLGADRNTLDVAPAATA